MLTAEIDQLLLCDPEKSGSVSHVFVAHPSPLEELSLGKLFFVATIRSTEPMNATILQAVQETLQDRYYHTEDFNVETAFEHALGAVNERLSGFVREGITDWVDATDLLIGVLKGDALLFARVGTILAYLIHRGRIVDVAGQASPAKEKANPLRLFSHVFVGRVSAGDHVLFCTTTLLDYLSVEKIRRIMTERLPRDTVMEIQELLREDLGRTAFAALFLRLADAEQPLTTPAQLSTGFRIAPTLSAPQSSMQELIRKEQATNELLEPSIWPSVARAIGGAWRTGINLFRTTVLRKPPLRPRPATSHRFYTKERRRGSLGGLMRILMAAGRALGAVTIAGSTKLIGIVRRRRTIAEDVKETPAIAEAGVRGFLARLAALPTNQKLMLIAAAFFLFFFSWNIVSRGKSDTTAQSQGQKVATIETIRGNIHDAEAFLSFGNDDGAKELLADAEKRIGELPNRRKDDKAVVAELTGLLEKAKELTRHRTIIAAPTVKAEFSTLTDKPLRRFVFLGGSLYAATETGDLASVELEEETTKLLTQSVPDLQDVTLAVAASSNAIVLADRTKGLVEFSKVTERFTPLTVTFTNVDRDFRGLAAFEGRIYFLDRKNNQIFRHLRGAASYGPATAWVKETGISFADAVDLMVDGSVYVLDTNGTVREFFQGRKTDFALQAVDPPLTQATRILGNAQATALYILDPAGKRLLVFSKAGKLFDQYESERFADAMDFAVDAKNKRAYILASTTAYEVPLNR